MKNDAEAKTKQRNNQIRQMHIKQTELVSTLNQTQSGRFKVDKDLLTARKQLHDTEEKLIEVRAQKREAEVEKHDALQRLDEMLSVIFHAENPDIDHLNDEYRPTKLAEMFWELYDIEWTAAYVIMEDKIFQDRHMIDFLLDVLMESYFFCKNEVDNSWNIVSKWVLDDGLPKVQQIRKALGYERKSIALELLPEIEQGKAEKSNKPRKGARKGWQGFVKRPNTDDQKTAQYTFIEYIDLILLVPFRILGLFCLWMCWPFGETTIIHDMVEASGLPWPKVVTWLLWGGLELFAFWKRWPSKGDSKTILSLISKDVEMKSMEDEMAVQKRKFEIILKGKNDEIDGGQKRLKTIEGERINFQNNLKQKDNDISKLQEEKNQLVKELCDVREQINNAEAKIKQRDEEIHHLQTKQTELASTLKLTESERLNFCNDLQTARKQLHDTEKKLFDTEKKLFEVREQKMEAEAEKHDALRRLSEMVSVKLRDNNPNIVDLNDENRPTKLAEMFSELYDNEWTAAYTVMEDNKFQDRQMIDFLLDVVMESYLFCKDEVEKSWIVVSEWFLDDGLPKVQQMRKALKDGRKVIALKRLQDIEQKYTSYIINICRHEPLKELFSSEDIRKYIALCLKLTLLMNTNDPPVYLECSGWKPLRDRQEEDNDLLESEHSVPELPGNGEQPKLQNREDKDSSNVVGTDKQGEAPTGNGDTGQDFKKEGDTEDIGEEGIENDVQINEDNKQGEGDLDPEESQNAGCSGERQIDKNQHVSGNNEHPNLTVSTKPSENTGGTDSIKNMEAELDEQREAVKGNVDSGKDLNSDDTENKEAALKCQINATPGVIGDSEQERIENGGQIAETKLNSVNDVGQNVDAKREEPQETIAPFQSDDDQGSMTEKIAGEMENSKQPCQKASIDPGAASPTTCEHDTQKAQIYDDNFEKSPETTGRKDEKDMPESNDPNSECKPSVKQLDQQNDNDDSNKISEGELNNEETAVATRGEFEKDKYKEYTTRGKYTEFYVWPIMYLHKGGPMLGKGIAQGVKDSKAEPSDKPWAWWK